MKPRVTVVDEDSWKRIEKNAEAAWIDGKSHVRGSDRSAKGLEDQLVGQIGEWALAKFCGQTETYFSRREEINRNPYSGDGGTDLLGFAVDVKTSLMRASRSPLKYNLAVRPGERHPGTIYVLGLVDSLSSRKVWLVGCCEEQNLPDEANKQGVFAGAYVVPATKLSDMGVVKALVT